MTLGEPSDRIPPPRRNIIWAAVRVGGWAGWDRGEEKRPSTAADERYITGRGA